MRASLHLRSPLKWAARTDSMWEAEYTQPNRVGRQLKYVFAVVRAAYNSGGLLDPTQGKWVVTNGHWADVRQFDTVLEAKTYVEALYALLD